MSKKPNHDWMPEHKRPTFIAMWWRKLTRKHPDDYESPFESLLAGIFACLCIFCILMLLAFIGEIQ